MTIITNHNYEKFAGECGICKEYTVLTEHHAKELGRDSTGSAHILKIWFESIIPVERKISIFIIVLGAVNSDRLVITPESGWGGRDIVVVFDS